MNKDVLVAGHICLDIIPEFHSRLSFQKDFLPGKLLQIGGAALAPGGPVSNTGLALHRLGIDVNLLGKIGNDEFGNLLRNLLKRYDEKLLNHIIVDHQVHSSYSIVLNLPDYDRLFLHCSGVNDFFCARDISPDALKNSKIFHFGYPPAMESMYVEKGRELSLLMRNVSEKGIFTSLDMSMPDSNTKSGQTDWIPILSETLPFVDLFIPSLEEVFYMLRRDWYDKTILQTGNSIFSVVTIAMIQEVTDELLQMGCSIVVIKMGEMGLYMKTSKNRIENIPLENSIRNNLECGSEINETVSKPDYHESKISSYRALVESWQNREIWTPAHNAVVKGTTGAGDSSIAGFLAGMLRGFTPENTLDFASAAGACCVESADAASRIVSWNQVQEKVEKQKYKDVFFDLSKWKKKAHQWFASGDKKFSEC